MNVIDYRSIKRPKQKRKRRSLALPLVGLVIVGIAVGTYFSQRSTAPETSEQSDSVGAESASQQSTEAPKTTLKFFTSEEFHDLYQSIAYPNTQELRIPPEITGNSEADQRIRTLAEKRGYMLRSVPVAPIKKLSEPGLGEDDLLQEKALLAWQELKSAAEAENIPLVLTSGYRSIEWQREYFNEQLRARGATAAQVAAGQADGVVNAIMTTVAVPGYSRHHTGYTIDFRCGNGSSSFDSTSCFRWLSKNNYENAKKYGWIPSYPVGLTNQGPDPEAWEYVWVSKDAVME